MSQTPKPGPKPVILEETEVQITENRSRLATLKRGLSECQTNLNKLTENLEDSKLLVSSYKEIFRSCLDSDLVSLEEIRKIRDIHERNIDMLVSYQIEKQTLVTYIKDLKRAIVETESKIKQLTSEKLTWNQILHFPTWNPTS